MAMRLSLAALTITVVLLTACSSVLPAPPTPEPFSAPPTVTPPAATMTATPAEQATAAPEQLASPTPAPENYTVSRGDVVQTAETQGTVVSLQRRNVAFNQAGQIKRITVPGLGPIQKGALLAEQDLGDLGKQIREAQAAFDSQRAAIDKAASTAGIPIRKAEIELQAARDALTEAQRPAKVEDLATAQAVIQRAEANLAKVRNDASQTKTQAEVVLKQKQQALIMAQAEFGTAAQAYEADKKDADKAERYNKAADALRTAEQEAASAKINYDTAFNNEIALIKDAEAGVSTAKADYERLKRLPDPFAVREAQRNIQRAQLALDEARVQARTDPEAVARLESARDTLTELQTLAESYRLYAPFSGEVIEIIARPGETVAAGQAVMVVMDASIPADSKELQIILTGSEIQDPNLIREGQTVLLSFSNTNGPQIKGTVTKVSNSTTEQLPIIHVAYDDKAAPTSIGDQATAIIEVVRHSNVLTLPVQAIRNDGRTFVLIPDGSSSKRVDVRLGLSTADKVEIVSGLKEGQLVLADR